jgi:hypothetical protein
MINITIKREIDVGVKVRMTPKSEDCKVTRRLGKYNSVSHIDQYRIQIDKSTV